MADEKKNPLIGAFRSPEPAKTSLDPKPAQSPGTTPPVPPKGEEIKKPVEPSKPDTDAKAAPTTGTAKAEEDKKSTEPIKSATDPKTVSASAANAPTQSGDIKKPAEQPQTAETLFVTQSIKIVDIHLTDGMFKFDKADPAFIALMEDIKKCGMKEAVNLNKRRDGSYDVIDGRRRLRAAQLLGLNEVPAITLNLPPSLARKGEVNANRPVEDSARVERKEDGEPPAPTKEAQAIRDSATAEPDKTGDDIPKDFKLTIVPESDLGKVVLLPIDLIDDFEGHPFPVTDDKEMWDLVASIKQFGVLENATVIPNEKTPGRYEMVAGHRRKRASQLAGLTHVPAIVRNMDHDTAVIFMVDSNMKRENLSPMVKARAYDMKLEAMKRKSGRRSKTEILNGEKPKQAVEELAAQTGESATTIKKIRNLVNLNPELQEMVDKNKIPVTTASDIASLKKEEQAVLADAMQREDKVPSITQAAELKAASKAGTLTTEKIEAVVAPTKREENPVLKVTFNDDELRDYFPDKHATVGDVKRGVFEALDLRKKALERKAQQAAQNAPDKKKPAPTR